MLQGREGFGSCERLRSLERRNDMIGKLVGAGKGGHPKREERLTISRGWEMGRDDGGERGEGYEESISRDHERSERTRRFRSWTGHRNVCGGEVRLRCLLRHEIGWYHGRECLLAPDFLASSSPSTTVNSSQDVSQPWHDCHVARCLSGYRFDQKAPR